MAHETFHAAGHILDRLTDAGGRLSITVSRHGAEMVSLRRDGIGFLFRDGDVTVNRAGWNNHSTVMGYFIHRLLHERTEYQGREIRGSTHSFIRHHDFAAPEVTENSLTYRLPAAAIPAEAYPRRVDFILRYALVGAGLEVTFRLENHEETSSAVSFGLHPGFAASPLSAVRVHLPAGNYRRWLAPGNFLSGEVQEFDFSGGLMPFDKAQLPGSFLLEMAGVPERIFIMEDPASGRRTTLDYGEAPYVTLWSDGSDYICIEPCWGLPDHHDQRPFELKEGMQHVPALGHLERSVRIIPEIIEGTGL